MKVSPRLLVLLLAVFLVSTAGLFGHRALAETTPLALAAWRLGLAALFFCGWSAVSSGSLPPNDPLALNNRRTGDRVIFPRLVLAGTCLAAHFICWFASLQYASVAHATLLVCTTPLWAMLGSRLLGRGRFVPVHGLALALAAIGMILVTQTGARGSHPASLLGDCLALLGGLLFAVYLLSVEGLHRVVSSQRQVTVAYTVAALLLWAGLLARGGATVHYSPGVWRAIAGMTIGPQMIGHTLLNSSLRFFPSSTVAFSILLEPIFAAVMAWLVFHQAVTPAQMLGGLLVLSGLALVIRHQTPAAQTIEEAVG